jgi:glutathione peroxidase
MEDLNSLYDIGVTTIDGRAERLDRYRHHTLLIVNVASRCVYTPQYAGLERLYRAYRERGLVVLGFPCDQFRHQEPGSEAEIQQFCAESYDVTFPMFAKIDVNGPRTHPLFVHLKSARKGLLGLGSIKWNFTKFLVDPDGRVVKRFGPARSPARIEKVLVSPGVLPSAGTSREPRR